MLFFRALDRNGYLLGRQVQHPLADLSPSFQLHPSIRIGVSWSDYLVDAITDPYYGCCTPTISIGTVRQPRTASFSMFIFAARLSVMWASQIIAMSTCCSMSHLITTDIFSASPNPRASSEISRIVRDGTIKPERFSLRNVTAIQAE